MRTNTNNDMIGVDINGIIRELALKETDVLVPLYECVVNSIQAIEELSEHTEKGNITIEISRDKTQLELFDKYSAYPFDSIKVTDNGIGFTDENYQSYCMAYSSKKNNIGGKGIGRFAMLSMFDHIEIQSIVETNSGNKKRLISLDRKDGVVEKEISDTQNKRCTIVSLLNFLPKFSKHSSKYNHEAIVDSILSHCLLYFLNGTAPSISVIDDGEAINLKNQFNPSDFILKKYVKSLKERSFTFYFVKSEKKCNSYNYCANNRRVKNKRISAIFPILNSQVCFNGEEQFFDLYIVSDYFDSIVNSSRTELLFPKDSDSPSLIETSDEITEKDVEGLVYDVLCEIFVEEISKRRELSKSSVDKFISTDEGLRYRHLHLSQEFYDKVPDNVSSRKLDELLHAEEFKHDLDVRERLTKLEERDYSNSTDYQDLLKEYVTMASDSGMSKLAEYIAHRKTIIDLFDKYLGWCENNDESYEKEETLHNLIYTMGGNHDTIKYDKHNLWLLDDRLTFCRYIYSDKQIKSHKPVEGIATSQKETDLAIYDTHFSYAEKDEYQEVKSVVLFEFKRPNREVTYADFSKQMLDQICGIEEGKTKDYQGRNVSLKENTPITFYYVCDVNTFNALKQRALKDGFNITPYNSLLKLVNNCHEEIITYQTLLLNARRRNAIFFKKLEIDK